MKAVLCKAWGPPDSLVLETLPDLVPGAGEVVIDVKAAGVNFPDVLIIQNKYQAKPQLPFSPGSELAGVVNAPSVDDPINDPVLDGLVGFGSIPAVKTLSWTRGASGSIAASTSMTCGKTSYCTSIMRLAGNSARQCAIKLS